MGSVPIFPGEVRCLHAPHGANRDPRRAAPRDPARQQDRRAGCGNRREDVLGDEDRRRCLLPLSRDAETPSPADAHGPSARRRGVRAPIRGTQRPVFGSSQGRQAQKGPKRWGGTKTWVASPSFLVLLEWTYTYVCYSCGNTVIEAIRTHDQTYGNGDQLYDSMIGTLRNLLPANVGF